MYKRLGDVKAISPEIKIGTRVYYTTTLQDKHLHAGENGVKIYTTDGKTKELKTGEWIGLVYSFEIQKDVNGNFFARLMFHKSEYFPQNNVYFLEFKGVNTISESLLRYNYKSVASVKLVSNLWLPFGPLLIPYVLYQKYKNAGSKAPDTLPTVEEQDKIDAERNKAEKDLDERDAKWEGLLIKGAVVVAALIVVNNLSK